MQTFHCGITASYTFLFLIQIVLSLQCYGPQGTGPTKFSSSLNFPLASFSNVQAKVYYYNHTFNYMVSLLLDCTLFAKLKFQMNTTTCFLNIPSWVVECSWRKLYNQAYCFYFNFMTSHLKWTQYWSAILRCLSIQLTFQYLRWLFYILSSLLSKLTLNHS